MGETTAKIADACRDNDYLGVEVHVPGVGALCKQIAERNLTNLRICQHDAVELVRDMLPEASLDGVHIFFPDPWHKARHNKRRLIQSPFVALLASRLKPGGYFHCATDWEEYAHQMLAVLSAEPTLVNSADGFAPRPEYRPLTKFENRGIRLGHGVWDVIFARWATWSAVVTPPIPTRPTVRRIHAPASRLSKSAVRNATPRAKMVHLNWAT
jgi:tRNA (guanine-N7-)-methyltransferase